MLQRLCCWLVGWFGGGGSEALPEYLSSEFFLLLYIYEGKFGKFIRMVVCFFLCIWCVSERGMRMGFRSIFKQRKDAAYGPLRPLLPTARVRCVYEQPTY